MGREGGGAAGRGIRGNTCQSQDGQEGEEGRGKEEEPAEEAPAADGECSLTLRAEARDQSGACDACEFGNNINLVAIIENPCQVPLTYRSQQDCIVSEFAVLNMESQSSALYPMTCRLGPRVEEIAPGASVTQARPAGRLSASRYELAVQFEDADRSRQVVVFTVD